VKQKASGLGMKALALVVVLIAAWVLFKLVLGFVTAVAWIAVVILAVLALGWAFVTLMR